MAAFIVIFWVSTTTFSSTVNLCLLAHSAALEPITVRKTGDVFLNALSAMVISFARMVT